MYLSMDFKDQFLKEQKGDIHSETLIDIETLMWENFKKLVIYLKLTIYSSWNWDTAPEFW